MSKAPKDAAEPYVALLRGINVGGKNMLPMKDLVAMLSDAGCADVRNYIQSGNVVFTARASLANRIPALVTTAIEKRFGFRVPIQVRKGIDLREVLRNNPFLDSGADVDRLHVAFLADEPSKSRVDDLNPKRSPPDAFAVRGREIYLHLPNGVARTKLSNAYFDGKLATISTVRNWRTVLKLAEMAGLA